MNGLMAIIRIVCLLSLGFSSAGFSEVIEPKSIIENAMQRYRGNSSIATMKMTIHRSDWQRSMTMKAWTQGDKHTLVRVIQPAKDVGNASLTKDKNMWSFSPKANRVIKVPSSMMNQSWMGSDFSNKDISKSTDIIDQYQHQLDGISEQDGHKVYTITSTPFDDAPVVWGKEVIQIRDDFVMLSQQFWDQDNLLVREMKAYEIKTIQGRPVATKIRMTDQENPQQWTEIETLDIEFDIELHSHLFTLSNLRNPRP
ncbi:outer membrane lipoprotein-sorting protein [Paraferrimonas sp. SM1919]|uniref:outer membrane lipoprotein-sorting protein n=1 Tax=Paraferrimonas sp. SM1919 TaxID=2662263 RepID=UPI00196A0403|nr:outer membrane lipoprotein-sorting protein [Paraferrimonas sp. SM1919]